MPKRHAITIFVSFLTLFLVMNVGVIRSCSGGTSHGKAMHAIGLQCTGNAIQHVAQQQSSFLGLAIGIVLLVVLVTEAQWTKREEDSPPFKRVVRDGNGFSLNMHYYDPCRPLLARGILGSQPTAASRL